MRLESNQMIWSKRHQERGQARLPDLRDSLSSSVDSEVESLSIKNCKHNFDQLMVGKVGLPPLSTPAPQAG
jgi:hypothetical protein